jgi:phytoene dehydrogenase-like protein
LSLDQPLSAAFGVLLGAAAHAVGWPIPRHGAQSITKALCSHLATFGVEVKTSTRIASVGAYPQYDLTLCDVTPRQLLPLAEQRLSAQCKRQLAKYRYGAGVFKVDYALAGPIPWKAPQCLRAATVHLGGSATEIAASEAAMRRGKPSERPFVLLAQASLFDATRAPAGKHTAWAYCHVPNGSEFDMLGRLEAQIERFAPGFRECILARRVFSPTTIEKMDANLVGGDISGGAMNVRQVVFRPTWRRYATSAGAGVHGMCGYHAARWALSRVKA